jgi:RNA polymerase sigma factor (sigma-70 family)
VTEGLKEKSPVEAVEADPPAVEATGPGPLSDLYRRCRKELVAFVRQRFGSGPPDPEDIAQQTFANFAALGPHKSIANPRAFLFRTAHNIALNERKHQRIGKRFLESNPDPREIREERDDFDPEVVLLTREQYSLIESVIRAMPPKRRQALLLSRLEGLSYVEIGRRLGQSESAVRKHVAAAIRECGAVLLSAEQPGLKYKRR